MKKSTARLLQLLVLGLSAGVAAGAAQQDAAPASQFDKPVQAIVTGLGGGATRMP